MCVVVGRRRGLTMGMAGVLEAAVGTGGAGGGEGGDAAVGGRGAAAWEEEKEGEAREGRRRREGLEAGAVGSAVRRASRSRRLMRCEPGLLLLLVGANKAWKTWEVSGADSCRPRRTRPPLRPLRLTKPATTRA